MKKKKTLEPFLTPSYIKPCENTSVCVVCYGGLTAVAAAPSAYSTRTSGGDTEKLMVMVMVMN